MISTKSCPGIYGSAYGEEYKVTAFGIPVEDHIKESFEVSVGQCEEERSVLFCYLLSFVSRLKSALFPIACCSLLLI